MRKLFKALLLVLGIAAGFIVITASIYIPFVVKDAKTPYNDDCDYLMILGNQVIGEETPSPLMLERIDRAIEYANENENCIIVPCGGITTEEQIKSEADLMAELLIDSGINPERIIPEDESTTTFENFEFAKEKIEVHSAKNIEDVNVAFLSSDYHIHRASVIAEHFGYKDIGKVSAVSEEGFIKSLVREYFVGYDLLIRLITK